MLILFAINQPGILIWDALGRLLPEIQVRSLLCQTASGTEDIKIVLVVK